MKGFDRIEAHEILCIKGQNAADAVYAHGGNEPYSGPSG
jgi:hypothetical protein